MNPDSMENRYQSLLSINKKFKQYNRAVAIFITIALGFFLSTSQISKLFNINFELLILVAVVFMLILVGFMSKSNKFRMKTDDRVFFRFYDTFKKSQIFIDAKNENSKKNASDSVMLLANYVESWTANAPDALSKIPSSISKNLKERMLPLINEERTNEISSFVNRLFNMLLGISNSGLTQDLLKSLDDTLNSFPIIKEVKRKKFRNISQKILKQKYPLIILTSSVIFAISQILQENAIGVVIQNALFFGLALIGVLVTIYAVERKTRTTVS